MKQKSCPRSITSLQTFRESLGANTSRQNFRRTNRRRHYALLAAVAAAFLVSISAAAHGTKETLNQLGRIDLIRGLDREIAVAKIALPRGKHGVFVNDKGQLDQERAQEELRTNGTAVRPGMPVEITKIKFKSHRIIFEINNGAKGKKWYQHIQVGMGGMAQPVVQGNENQGLAYGSSITLTFEGEKVPNLSVEQAKQLLHEVLDFHRQLPTELYSPSIPEKFKEAIKNHQVLVGMNRDAVLSSKGPPFRKIRQTKPNGDETEDWLYGLPPHVLFVTFEGDSVVAVRQY
ncbi:MAG: hypothetical protein M1404_03910 [Acidobacteria bacterium]|nr:hypothetical protein [Acidobacteriota bacterium]